MMSGVYDNWERLVAATLKREQFRQLCLAPSFSSTSSFDSSLNSSPLHYSFLNFGSHGEASKIPSETSSSSAASSARSEAYILSSSTAKPILLDELKTATENFHPDRLLRDGKYGSLFKGWIHQRILSVAMPSARKAVAIKKLNLRHFELHSDGDWIREIEYLGKFHHPNLVRLIGYCNVEKDKFLVFELEQQGSLKRHLFRRNIQPLSWETRLKVAIGAARGLSFLHEAKPPVIHPNFTSSSILLDENFNAKLSGFGLAMFRLPLSKPGRMYVDELELSERTTRDDKYAPQEHILTGEVSTKCDVYSFGVVLLELLSGRRASDKPFGFKTLADWAKPYLHDRKKLGQIVDSRLGSKYPMEGAERVAAIAELCLSNDPVDRPSMAIVVAALEKLQASRKSIF